MTAYEPSIRPRGRSDFAEIDRLRLHYLSYGEAGRQALVVVPGITSPAVTWEFVAEELVSDYRVIVTDTRGRGLSEPGAAGTYTIPVYARDVVELVRVLGIEHPIVIGHSMGARAVAGLAALHPSVARGVIVVDPPLTGPGREPYSTPLEDFVSSLRRARAGATADDMRPSFPTWTEEQLALRADWLATCDEEAVVESYANLHDEDFFAYWKDVPPPALFLYGDGSPAVPKEGIPEVAAANPRATIVEIADAGHMIPWDNLPAFLRQVRAFGDQLA